MAKGKMDEYTRSWIIENSVNILDRYEEGILTIRALHYQLVSIGMTNDIQHYKRVVAAMEKARWDGLVSFEAFSDRDREMVTSTPYEEESLAEKEDKAKEQVGLWMTSYYRNKWENQPYYPEVLIEKKALEGVFYRPCKRLEVALGACKGYPSLTFLHDMYVRMKQAKREGKEPVILYFGDYDPSGEDIPRSIYENLKKFGIRVEIDRIALKEEQVLDWNLPPAPAKLTDSRTANWDGLGQVELDAVRPEILVEMLEDSVGNYFDENLFDDIKNREERERKIFKQNLKDYVKTL